VLPHDPASTLNFLIPPVCEREGERERERERESYRQRQEERQRVTERDRERDRELQRETERETESYRQGFPFDPEGHAWSGSSPPLFCCIVALEHCVAWSNLIACTTWLVSLAASMRRGPVWALPLALDLI